ncbi:hypothetical protein ANN_16311 [Periplaneta americana]|uniref:Uncharacterized protein n=1 Tax=Periplaneta americana TaxID=6978 RepID=A0ABQ8SIQ7_PERAM|nr:hypothetical protein ANN_16311 [Periplaneta americana]
MAGLCEGGNEPPGSLKATFNNSLHGTQGHAFEIRLAANICYHCDDILTYVMGCIPCVHLVKSCTNSALRTVVPLQAAESVATSVANWTEIPSKLTEFQRSGREKNVFDG